MYKIEKNMKNVKMSEIFPAVCYLLDIQKSIKLTVTGGSMYPFLRDGIDSVVLSPLISGRAKRGDIVLYMRKNGQFVLHRIMKKNRYGYCLAGDAQQCVEGSIETSQLIAVVEGIYRKDKYIDSTWLFLRIMVYIWSLLLPFRYSIIKSYKVIRIVFTKLTKMF